MKSFTSQTWQVGLLVVLTGGALSLYLYFRSPRPAGGPVATSAPASPAAPGLAHFQAWIAEHEPSWRANEFVSLDDRPRVTTVLREAVSARRGIVELNEAELVACLSDFLWAIAASSPDEYFRRAGTGRVLGPDEFNARFVHTLHRHLLNEPLPPEFDPQAVFQRFWEFDRAGLGRPTRVATRALVFVGTSQAVELDQVPHGQRLLALVEPRAMGQLYESEAESLYWIGPGSRGAVALTRPTRSLHSVLRESGQTALAITHLIAQSQKGDVFPIGLTLYADSAGQWHVEGLCSSTIKDLAWPY